MQVFPPGANGLARLMILGIVALIMGLLAAAYIWVRSSYVTGQYVTVPQPVQFSHQHHVSQLGIRCQYCHTSVTTSSSAGIPPIHTCMTCHSQIWTEAPILEPVRASYATGEPLAWNRVHDLPDYVYFNHSIHVQKGVGCSTCHGRVDQMELVYQAESLTMGWCLECHTAPEHYLRPADEIFNMEYVQPADQTILGQRLIAQYEIDVRRLSNCYVCHR
ncbi:MAG: cytochrome c3 family protein [Oscillochloris sp.]|nr:cytochrome c3 family protein [Oscillochloris sp.]